MSDDKERKRKAIDFLEPLFPNGYTLVLRDPDGAFCMCASGPDGEAFEEMYDIMRGESEAFRDLESHAKAKGDEKAREAMTTAIQLTKDLKRVFPSGFVLVTKRPDTTPDGIEFTFGFSGKLGRSFSRHYVGLLNRASVPVQKDGEPEVFTMLGAKYDGLKA